MTAVPLLAGLATENTQAALVGQIADIAAALAALPADVATQVDAAKVSLSGPRTVAPDAIAGSVIGQASSTISGAVLSVLSNASGGGRFALDAQNRLVTTATALLPGETYSLAIRAAGVSEAAERRFDIHVGEALAVLSPTAAYIAKTRAAGSLLSVVAGLSPGSLLTLDDDAGGKVSIGSRRRLMVGAAGLAASASPLTFTLREAFADGRVAPRTTVVALPTQAPALGAPLACYAVKKLIPSYAGPCVRAVRVSDSVEQDIGFDANGNIDIAAISAFGAASVVRCKTWYDQTGHGHHITQATAAQQPVLNPASLFKGVMPVGFDSLYNTAGAGRYMAIPTGVAFNRADVTVLSVVAALTTLQAHTWWSYRNAAVPATIDLTLNKATVSASHRVTANASLTFNTPPRTTPQVMAVHSTGAGLTSVVGQKTFTGAAFTAANSAGGFLGFGEGDNQKMARSEFYAHVVYANALPGYMDAIASLNETFALDDGAAEALLYVHGDSHADTYRTIRTWPRQAEPLLTTSCEIYNGGLASYTMATLLSAGVFDALVAPTINAFPLTKKVIFLDAATNDLNNGMSADLLIATLQSYSRKVRALGARLIVCTVLPRWANNPWAGQPAIELAAYNAWLRANWSTVADGFADGAANAAIIAQAAANDPDWADYLHPGPVALGILAGLYAPVINAVLAS